MLIGIPPARSVSPSGRRRLRRVEGDRTSKSAASRRFLALSQQRSGMAQRCAHIRSPSRLQDLPSMTVACYQLHPELIGQGSANIAAASIVGILLGF
jgi:hypothetical protein